MKEAQWRERSKDTADETEEVTDDDLIILLLRCYRFDNDE